MNYELFTAFLLITVVLAITPGPVVTLVITTAAREGIRAGLLTVAGTMIGNALLISAIAFGLSFVIRNAAILFEAMRWIGAAYLIWLGIQAWRGAGTAATAPVSRRHLKFVRGILVALSNPKTVAFFTAFLPQFVDPLLPVERQLIVMCAASVLIVGAFDCGWAVAAGAGRAFFLKPARQRLLARLSGVALIGGGIWLSLARRPV